MPFPTIRSRWNASGAPVYQLPESLRNKPEWQPQSQMDLANNAINIPSGMGAANQSDSQIKIDANSGTLDSRVQAQGPLKPSLQAPIGASQGSQPLISLPDAYRQQYGGPSTTPPNTLQMPDMTPRVGQGFTPSVNWSDFLTVAHNRYTR